MRRRSRTCSRSLSASTRWTASCHLSAAGAGTAEIVSRSPGAWQIQTSSREAALLVLSETAYPGWAVRVDDEYGWYVGWVERGQRTAYFATNIAIRSMDDVRKRYTVSRALLQRNGWIDPPGP